jgi:predicted ATP-grasp superfamily ATP-dependent carboligase
VLRARGEQPEGGLPAAHDRPEGEIAAQFVEEFAQPHARLRRLLAVAHMDDGVSLVEQHRRGRDELEEIAARAVAEEGRG